MSATWHDQKDAAVYQLNRAIEIFLDQNDYYASATLAGASEEILGTLLTKSGREHSFGKMKSRLSKMLSENEKAAIDGERGLVSLLNEYRNWLKHSKQDDHEIYIDSEAESFALIERAYENWVALGEKDTEQMSRFAEYARSRYS